MDSVTQNSTSVNTPPALEVLKPGIQWVCFDEEKKPISPLTLKGVSGALVEGNPDWTSYTKAVKVWKATSDKLKGVGREFIKSQNITGIDLDNCIDEQGNIASWAQAEIDRLGSYTELSPSGRGVHIWTYGSIPCAIAPAKPEPDGYEMYDSGRYFTITGKHLPGTPLTIEDRHKEVLQLHSEIIARRKPPSATHKQPRKRTATQGTREEAYAQKAMDNIYMDLAATREGARNQHLYQAAFRLGTMIGADWISRSVVEQGLRYAATRCGLSTQETERTLRSGIDGGIKVPHEPLKTDSTYVEYKAEPGGAGNGNGNGHHDTTFDLCSFDADDAGNSDAMNALYGRDFLYCASLGWLRYTNTHWSLDADGAEVRKRAIETLRLRRHAAVDAEKEAIIKCTKADERRVNGCVSLFKTHVSADIKTFDCDPDVLNCKNGVVNLRTGIIEPHSRAQRFTYCVPVEYDLQADSSQWVSYLRGVIGGGPEVIDYVQEALGYSFTGHTQEEILFYLFGPTRSGKGTYAETIMTLLPTPLSKMVDFQSFTAKREGDVSNFDLAPLKPARIIFASESNKSQNLNPAKIKQLTGGDHISCCFKHKDFFSYRPQFKVWMMSNHPVNGDPEDDALWGRVRVIEFPHSFLGMEDKTKKARLKEPDALKGVLAWIVQGAARWYALGSQGLITPEAIEAITKAQRDDLDLVQQWLDECCEDNEGGWSSNEEVMTSYTAWCKSNNVQYPKGSKGLAQSLKGKGYEPGLAKKVGGKTKRGVGGLYIYPENEEPI